MRWIAIGKKLPFVREWVDYYANYYTDAWTYLNGGRHLRAAEAWDELKADLAAEPQRDLPPDVQKAMVQILLDTISAAIPGAAPAVAAGMQKSDEMTEEYARNYLDVVLDRSKMSKFNWDLEMLRSQCNSREMDRGTSKIDGAAPPAWTKANECLDKLRQNRMSVLLGPGLDALETQILHENSGKSGALKEIRTLIRQIKRYTNDRDPYLFAAVLDNAEIETWQARIASLFVPAFKHVRKHRQDLRQPLYVESVYYLAQSLLMSFEAERLKTAYQRAKKLREVRLAPNLSEREQNLVLLTVCLEIEALIRIAEVKRMPEGRVQLEDPLEFEESYEFDLLVEEWDEQLERAATATSRRRDARAATCVALGMISRRTRRENARQRWSSRDELDEEKQLQAWYDEVGHYRKAVELQPAASTHCYIAECLLEPEGKETELNAKEAAAHVYEALRMAPDHVLANKLFRAIASPRGA